MSRVWFNSTYYLIPKRVILYLISLHFFTAQEELSGHWWVTLSNQLKFVGYWPKDLVDIDGASNVGWGAFTNPRTTGVNPSMGSGHKPDHVYNHAAYFRDMKYLKKELEPQIPADTELETFVDPCYAIDDLHYSGSPYWDYDFFFRGPGGSCGHGFQTRTVH